MKATELIDFVEAELSYPTDLNQMVHILYPNDRRVPALQIMAWAGDAFEDGEIDHAPKDLWDAIEMLDDAGIITVHKKWWESFKETAYASYGPSGMPGYKSYTGDLKAEAGHRRGSYGGLSPRERELKRAELNKIKKQGKELRREYKDFMKSLRRFGDEE